MNSKIILKFARLFLKASSLLDISLSPKEQQIFSVLKSVVQEKSPSTTLRVAGGWVRDKLLGKQSNDIDISIDNMSGEQFALLVKQFLAEHKVKTGNVTVVKANPDQSKHLATAMLQIFGQPIDFVQLRSESYAEDSRIPTAVKPGTPQEDAERRDLTINSLFYNINNGQVEDFVGGIEDLKNKVARTPLNPYQTFKDDPLRILRTIRFASKYDLELDPSLVEAAKQPDIQQALKDKISKERIWAELAWKSDEQGMPKPGALTGNNPEKTAKLMAELGVRDSLLHLSPEELQALGLKGQLVSFDQDQDNPYHDLSIWDHTVKVLKELVNLTGPDVKTDIKRFAVRNLAAILHDIGKRLTSIQAKHPQYGYTTYNKHEEVSEKLAEIILGRLGAPKDVIEKVRMLAGEHMRPHSMVSAGAVTDKALRKLMRDMGEMYPDLIELSAADALGRSEPEPGLVEKYQGLQQRMERAQQQMGGQTKPPRPISGHDLMALGVPAGPKMGEIFRALDEELLNNPDMTKEEALELAKSIKGFIHS
jgi:tRNA nucleotidyltransferase/poly(A) polymerase